MGLALLAQILAGGLGLVCGFVAHYSAKGGETASQKRDGVHLCEAHGVVIGVAIAAVLITMF